MTSQATFPNVESAIATHDDAGQSPCDVRRPPSPTWSPPSPPTSAPGASSSTTRGCSRWCSCTRPTSCATGSCSRAQALFNSLHVLLHVSSIYCPSCDKVIQLYETCLVRHGINALEPRPILPPPPSPLAYTHTTHTTHQPTQPRSHPPVPLSFPVPPTPTLFHFGGTAEVKKYNG